MSAEIGSISVALPSSARPRRRERKYFNGTSSILLRAEDTVQRGAGAAFVRVSAQEFQRADDALLDGERRFPAQAPQARAIQEDERAVGHPTTFAAGVAPFRLKAEMPGDPADGVVNLAILIRAQVENVDRVRAALRRQQDGVDAILHVEVRFPLEAVAQPVEAMGMFQQLPVEVEHVPVGVALAQNRYEAEDGPLEPERRRVGRKHPLRPDR